MCLTWKHTVTGYNPPTAFGEGLTIFVRRWSSEKERNMCLDDLVFDEEAVVFSREQIVQAADAVEQRLTKDFPLTLNELLPLLAHQSTSRDA